MAITTIDNLQEIQSAGANDVLPISTGNGVKKIKASALGGGAESVVVEFNTDETGIVTETSIVDIIAAFSAGKLVQGKVAQSDTDYLFGLLTDVGTESASFMFFTYGGTGGSDTMIVYLHGSIASGGTESWSMTMFPLTPMS